MNKFVLGALVIVAVAVVAVSVVHVCTSPSEDEAVRSESTPKRQLKGRGSKAVRPAAARNGRGDAGKASGAVSKDAKQGTNKDGENGMVIVMRAEDEALLSCPNPGLTPDLMKELSGVFSQADAADLTDVQFAKVLANYNPSVVLGAAASIMKKGTPREKMNALCAVGMLFGEESATGIPFDVTHPKEIVIHDGGDAPDAPSDTGNAVKEDVAPAARPTHELISTVCAGLSDVDAGVREAAFNVMRSLPDEEGGVLMANLLSEGDADLQKRLMREADDGGNGIRISLMGMGSESQEVRSLAAENLRHASGQEFASQSEAAKWYEAYSKKFPQGVGKLTPESGTK